jgi:hypothetical protein
MITNISRDINKRIEDLIKALKLNRNQFALAIKKNPTVLHNIIEGRNYPGYVFLRNIIEAFPAVSAEWLLTGKGEMFKNYNEKLSPVLENVVLMNDSKSLSGNDYLLKISIRHEPLAIV